MNRPKAKKPKLQQSTLDGGTTSATSTKKKGVKFIDAHLLSYGLTIGSRDKADGAVKTLVCRFCLVFGRETPHGSENGKPKSRQTTPTPKTYAAFRTDYYEKHAALKHASKWTEFRLLSTDDEKNKFFQQSSVPYAETVRASFESEDAIHFQVGNAIVETIIGGQLFHPDDVGGVSHKRAMAIFTPRGASYSITENNPSRFRLCARFMSHGASFRMAAAHMDATLIETGIGRLGGCSEAVAARYARVVCAVALQRLGDALNGVWAFSIALDGATHQGKSYVDVRCRFSSKGSLCNFHLLAVPLFDRHTAANIFEAVTTFLDALTSTWRDKLIGVATDGAATMMGRHAGVSTQLENEAAYAVTRVWCGLHQLDLKMQIVFENALNETYLSTLTSLISHLRRQQNLITEMKTRCPKLSENPAVPSPNLVWWVFLHALRELAREANAVFVSLQGYTTLVQQQRDRLDGLVKRLCKMSGAEGPLSPQELSVLADGTEVHEAIGLFAISHAKTHHFVSELDSWVCLRLRDILPDQRQVLVVAVARMFVLAADGIHKLALSTDIPPPVTPKDLVSTSMMQFVELLQSREEQLQSHFGTSALHKIGSEFKELRRTYDSDEGFRVAIDNFDHRLAVYDDMWALGNASQRFPVLFDFCGGLASAFPNTATVESDFSIIACEKTDRRTALTDLSLEGILHCKQWDRLTQL